MMLIDTTPHAVSPTRTAPVAMDAETFRRLGHQLVDQLAGCLDAIPAGRVTADPSPAALREAMGLDDPLPEAGTDAGPLLEQTTRWLFANSLFNAHPRFFGYVTAPPAPIGILGDLLASALNPNVGAWALAPAATEIEAQVVRWIASFIGFPAGGSGLMVSGGNMANVACLLAARAARAPWDVRTKGMHDPSARALRIYASTETHTWLNKAADMSGLGTAAIRWIPTDRELRMDMAALGSQIAADVAAGDVPLVIVGTAGSVSTGAIDPLHEIAVVARAHDAWFHVDGAYGGFAAALPDASSDLHALAEADSVAVDPHKWLYAPLEAGCALVRDPNALRAAFAYHPPYYHFGEEALNYVDLGPQNSRGFRALKVWLALKQVGAAGYRTMIADDIRLSREMADAVARHPELEFMTQSLSITTFRYVPSALRARVGEAEVEQLLDAINRELVDRLQREGELFLSNAVSGGRYALRACIVNFHTDARDVEAVPEIVARVGRRVAAGIAPSLGDA